MDLTIAFALLGVILAWILVSSSTKKRLNLPPSPPSLPILGHLHLLNGLAPHKSLVNLANKYGPFMLLNLGTKPTLIVSSPQAAEEMLKTNDLAFASRPLTALTKVFLSNGNYLGMAPYGKNWRDLRKLCVLELFTVRRVDLFQPIREREMAVLLKKLQAASSRKETVNMTEALSELTYNVIAKLVMGKSPESSDPEEARQAREFRHILLKINTFAGSVHISDCIPWLEMFDSSVPAMKKVFKTVMGILARHVKEHRAKYDPENLKDFMDVMISTFEGTQFGDSTIQSVVLDISIAATETTATSVEWALTELVRRPEKLLKAQQELDAVVGTDLDDELVREVHVPKLKYLQAVVKEVFRLHPPLPLMVPHESVEDCTLKAGYTIPAKTRMMVNIYAIGRDPLVWENPSEFEPERMQDENRKQEIGQSFELMPFGFGRRSCPALNMGMATVHLMLANLLYKYDWYPIEGSASREEGFGITLQRKNPLYLIPVPRFKC